MDNQPRNDKHHCNNSSNELNTTIKNSYVLPSRGWEAGARAKLVAADTGVVHLYARSAAAYASLQAQIDAMTGAGIKGALRPPRKSPWRPLETAAGADEGQALRGEFCCRDSNASLGHLAVREAVSRVVSYLLLVMS